MTLYMELIENKILNSAINTIVFNNIPQTYKDLVLKMSLRTNESATETQFFMSYNGSSSNFNYNTLFSNGTASGGAQDAFSRIGTCAGNSVLANTFSTHEIYIPKYNTNDFKQAVCNSAIETNAQFAVISQTALLSRNAAAITSLSIFAFGSFTFSINSVISLYGVKNA